MIRRHWLTGLLILVACLVGCGGPRDYCETLVKVQTKCEFDFLETLAGTYEDVDECVSVELQYPECGYDRCALCFEEHEGESCSEISDACEEDACGCSETSKVMIGN